jgi:protein dithiol oxidoreductase (disulfide-forming)
MKAIGTLLTFLVVVSLAGAAPAPSGAAGAAPSGDWVEGRNYFVVQQPQQTGLPAGKVLVTEVFSYACPACNQFQPYMQKLVKSLPANAVVEYVPAAFNSAEDWPMFQLAYATAQALGVADKAHEAMYTAVWTTGELATTDPGSGNLKSRMPTIEDAARFYQKQAGVPAGKFVETSKSFSVDNQVRRYQQLVVAYGVDRTPTLIVNGKWRVHVQAAGSADKLIELVNYLVAKESR